MADFQIPETYNLELRLLATIINDPTMIDFVARNIKEDMFTSPENKEVWRVVNDMINKGEVVNIITISPKVNNKHFRSNIVPTPPEFGINALEALISAFIDTHIKRLAYITAVDALQRIEKGNSCVDIQNLYEGFTRRVSEGMKDEGTKNTIEIANSLAESIAKGETNTIPTGFPSVDFNTYGGLGGGNLVILAARPSVGKTQIALQIALQTARRGKKTFICSLEMTKEELVQRLILSTGIIPPIQFYSKNFDWNDYERAVREVCTPNLVINDKVIGIDEICQKIRIECKSGGCKLAVVDYLGLIPITDRRMNTATALGEFTRKLKNLAKDCNIPIVLLAQLNRESEKDSRAPQLHDLRDSGAIEQDADKVIMLQRTRDEMGEIVPNTIDLWLRKARNGKCNFDSPIVLKGDENYSNFKEKK